MSVLHGFSDACAKLATPGFVLELFGEDYLGASAFFALGTVEQIRDYAYSLRGKVMAQGAEASEEPQPQHADTHAGCAVDEDCELCG